MRILGIDYGSQRIGLAISDEDGRLATPLPTVDRREQGKAVERVAAICTDLGAEKVLLGLPLAMSGDEGPQAKRVRAFGSALQVLTGCSVVYWDERLTSMGAERALTAAGVRGERKRQIVDQAVAVRLLQGYLDANSESEWSGNESVEQGVAGTEAVLHRGARARRGRRKSS